MEAEILMRHLRAEAQEGSGAQETGTPPRPADSAPRALPADDKPAETVFTLDLLVDRQAAGQRADAWIAGRFSRHSRSAVVRLFKEGRVVGLDRPLKPGSILVEGERIRMLRPGLVPSSPPPSLPPVLYEDKHIMALDKPAGLLVHPTGSSFVWALVGLVRRARPGCPVHLAHRLDRDTSGVVLLAKDPRAKSHLSAVFSGQYAEKVYWAVVRGSPSWSSCLVDEPIGPALNSAIRIRVAVRPDGLPARTRVFVLARFRGMSLLACHPRSGRTHQIRVHLAHLGHPILGDRIYGQPDDLFLGILEKGFDTQALHRAGFPRQALHARAIRFPHPDGHPMEVRAPLAADLRRLLRAGAPPFHQQSP